MSIGVALFSTASKAFVDVTAAAANWPPEQQEPIESFKFSGSDRKFERPHGLIKLVKVRQQQVVGASNQLEALNVCDQIFPLRKNILDQSKREKVMKIYE